MDLYDYQWEVIQPALEGQNIIIWLPTGSGKTRAAVYVTKRHLQNKRNAKVAVLVNKVHLVDQLYTKEFNPHLKDDYRLIAISGDSDEKCFFADAVKTHDVIVCTAQILQNALEAKDELKHVELTDFTLLVIDECHHTHKDGVYNKLMESYVEKKLRQEWSLPQILGLTASPGTGRATNIDRAKEHILQICANLDTWKIMSPKVHRPQLEEKAQQPQKEYNLTDQRPQDPFGDRLKRIMNAIHDHLDDDELQGTELGTQIYEQKIVELEKEENKQELSQLANDTRYQNPKLQMLEKILLEHFAYSAESCGIIFTKTRLSTHSLHEWICTSDGLEGLAKITAALTGTGSNSQTKHMTPCEQKEVIKRFREGKLKLLVSTSVAEEGLDIPACNIVIRYGLMTNETAMIQARGRARAPDSTYSILAARGGKEVRRECTNECLEDLMKRAIEAVQAMPEAEYLLEIRKLQTESIISRKMKQQKLDEKKRTFRPHDVRLYCRNCNEAVAHGNDLRTIENSHHVNISLDFKIYYNVSDTPVDLGRKMIDWEAGGLISCTCGQEWGMEIVYRAVNLPAISIKNFVVETSDGHRKTYKKWKDVPFAVEEMNYEEVCALHYSDLSD
ncbi:ATP-dependent RNA helicase DHX58-like isoform X3 [Lissotriton helveticus]